MIGSFRRGMSLFLPSRVWFDAWPRVPLAVRNTNFCISMRVFDFLFSEKTPLAVQPKSTFVCTTAHVRVEVRSVRVLCRHRVCCHFHVSNPVFFPPLQQLTNCILDCFCDERWLDGRRRTCPTSSPRQERPLPVSYFSIRWVDTVLQCHEPVSPLTSLRGTHVCRMLQCAGAEI